jgi:hypothetical protein
MADQARFPHAPYDSVNRLHLRFDVFRAISQAQAQGSKQFYKFRHACDHDNLLAPNIQ